MIASAASSASVTGLASALVRTVLPVLRTRMMAAPACEARSVNASTSEGSVNSVVMPQLP
jgi:hypothetical protein